MYEATVRYYNYPSLVKFFQEHSEEEAAKRSLQFKISGTNAIYRRFVERWSR